MGITKIYLKVENIVWTCLIIFSKISPVCKRTRKNNMNNILNERYFDEYFFEGYINTGISLSTSLVEEMQQHYKNLEEGRNDYPQYFKENEHQAYLEGKVTGTIFNMMPRFAEKMVTKLYDDAYNKAAHLELIYIEKVFEELLQQDFKRFFETRYIVASYDIYLGNSRERRSFTDIHSDVPNFHHFYETENDITVYIPLVDVNEENGGRLSILPECKSNLKVPGNLLLKLYEDAFLDKPDCLDENGYIVPEKIKDKDLQAFIKSASYKELLQIYKTSTALVRKYHRDSFIKSDWNAGKVVLFNNKTFHAAETWTGDDYNREIYMIRLLPVYDTKIQLKSTLHGKPFNRYLIDTHTNEFHKFDNSVDFSKIADEHKLPLTVH